MARVVLDSTTLDALIAAGDEQHHVLGNVPCWCHRNVPYNSGKVAQFVTKECARCKSRREWEAAKAAVTKAVKAA